MSGEVKKSMQDLYKIKCLGDGVMLVCKNK